MEEPSTLYVKGFNHGYLMREHYPQVKLPEKAQGHEDYLKGFDAGGRQYDMEYNRNKMRQQFGLDNNQEKGHERER